MAVTNSGLTTIYICDQCGLMAPGVVGTSPSAYANHLPQWMPVEWRLRRLVYQEGQWHSEPWSIHYPGGDYATFHFCGQACDDQWYAEHHVQGSPIWYTVHNTQQVKR